jgi:hypothetical protein
MFLVHPTLSATHTDRTGEVVHSVMQAASA